MATLTTDEARTAATHLAYLACAIAKWFEGCTEEEKQRKLDFVVRFLTPEDWLPAPKTQGFDTFAATFFHGMPSIPEHVLWAYKAFYEEGFAAGVQAEQQRERR